MNTSERNNGNTYPGLTLSARATAVDVTDETLSVTLEDGRRVSVPLVWFPRLMAGTEEQRRHWKLIGRGIGIHWPDIDEHISVENLLATRAEQLLVYKESPTPSKTDPVEEGLVTL